MAREPWKRVCTGGAESSEPLVWVSPAKGLGGATLVAIAPVVEGSEMYWIHHGQVYSVVAENEEGFWYMPSYGGPSIFMPWDKAKALHEVDEDNTGILIMGVQS